MTTRSLAAVFAAGVACAAMPAPATAAKPATAARPATSEGPLTVTTRMMVERRVAASDGSTRTTVVPAARAVPGDRITVVVAYRNTGSVALGNVVRANPVPRNVGYRGAAAEAPEVSVDGKTYGALADLRVATPDGGTRAAGAADVTHVRWRLPGTLAAGQGGERAFQAVLK